MKAKVAIAMIVGGAIGITAGLLAQPLLDSEPVQRFVRTTKRAAKRCSDNISEMM